MSRYFQQCFLIFLVLIFIALSCWGWCYLQRPTTLPFHQTRFVYPTQHIDQQQLSQLVWRNLEGGFFSLNVDKLKEALLRQPWVARVSIRREWPDTLALSIEEKRPQARWGKNGVLSTEGEVFYPSLEAIPATLPTIMAPQGQEKEVLANLQTLDHALQRLNLHIQRLDVTRRGDYHVILSNGVPVMIGRDHLLVRFDRFVHLYPKIIGLKSKRVVRVDLRYSSGLAIQWHS